MTPAVDDLEGVAEVRHVLKVDNVSKRFAGVQALWDVSLCLRAGEIHGLIGLNGSGKSTLVKILSGYHSPDSGRVLVRGGGDSDWEQATADSMAFVHQDLGLVKTLTVAENLALGRHYLMRGGRIDWKSEKSRADAALEPFGMTGSSDWRVGTLTRAEATIVAMVRALERQKDEHSKILVLDEPTAALPAAQADKLLDVIRRTAASGVAVLFISHRMSELAAICTSLTVLRNGVVAFSGPTAGSEVHELASFMLGDLDARQETRDEIALAGVDGPTRAEASSPRSTIATVEEVHLGPLHGVNLRVRRGEVVGVTGLLGDGVEELGLVLSGRLAPREGVVLFEDSVLAPGDGRLRTDVGLVPADRLSSGVIPSMTLRENVALPNVQRFLGRLFIDAKAERADTRGWINALQVKAPGPEVPIGFLSGGNQQKCVLARWLSAGVKMLVAIEPTQGIDIHAKREVLDRLREAASDGMAVAIFSHDVEEVLGSCDRIVVLSNGEVIADTPVRDTSLRQVLALMSAPMKVEGAVT